MGRIAMIMIWPAGPKTEKPGIRPARGWRKRNTAGGC